MPTVKNLVWAQEVKGREKKVYTKCGILFIKDDGGFSVKVDVMPTHNFDGWFQVYDQTPRDNKPQELAPEEVTDLEAF